MENKTILWAAIGTLAGASLLYYFSLDNSTGIKLDPKIHTD
jgi:preprotein translocase subunit Sec61beta